MGLAQAAYRGHIGPGPASPRQADCVSELDQTGFGFLAAHTEEPIYYG